MLKFDRIRLETKDDPKSGDILKLSIYLQGDSDSSEDSHSVLTNQNVISIEDVSDYFYYKYSNPKTYMELSKLEEFENKKIERDATITYVSQDLCRIYDFIEEVKNTNRK